MECTFPVNGKLKFRDLSVSWEKKDELGKDVYVLFKGEEDFKSQHSDFRGRIKLLKENLKLGQSLLQIMDVKLRDAGLYRCLIDYGGADYKTINLKVQGEFYHRMFTARWYCWKILGASWKEGMSALAFQESFLETGKASWPLHSCVFIYVESMFCPLFSRHMVWQKPFRQRKDQKAIATSRTVSTL